MSLEYQAREAFFAHHVTGPARTWSFLLPFYDQMDIPEHLNLTIDAVSLAHLSHEVYSETALITAKKKYISALHMTNRALESPSVAAENATLVTSMLLDLFEKITNIESHHIGSWSSHINGALALVGLRALDEFSELSNIDILVRLSTNMIISCIASESPVPEDLVEMRNYAGEFLNLKDPKWKLSDLMIEYCGLRSDIRRNHITTEEAIFASLELDSKLEMLALDMPGSWQYKTTIVEEDVEGVRGRYFHVYPEQRITQTWNVLRLSRIFLNEFVLEHSRISLSPSTLIRAKRNIAILVDDICASLPQYVSCPERSRVSCLISNGSTSVSSIVHQHSPSQKLDCYTLIFPLYVAARSPGTAKTISLWAIKQLHHMSDHFGIRNAVLVARILEIQADISPWAVYAMLGGYAFAACG